MSKFCSNCGKELGKETSICPNCGAPISQPNTQEVANQNNVTNNNPTNGMAIAGFVLSLVSLFCCGISSILGLIFQLLG